MPARLSHCLAVSIPDRGPSRTCSYLSVQLAEMLRQLECGLRWLFPLVCARDDESAKLYPKG